MKIEKNIIIFTLLFVVFSWAVPAFALFEPDQTDTVKPSQMPPTEYEKSRQPKFHPGEIIVKIKEGKGGIDSLQVLNRANDVTSIEPLISNVLSPEEILKEKKQEFAKLEVLEKESLPKQSNNKGESTKELATIKQQKKDLQALIDQYQALIERIAIRKQRASSSEKENVTLENIYLIKFRDQNIDINEMIAQYSTDPAVEYAEPNYEVKTFGLLPNPELWGLSKISADKSFDFKKDEKNPVIVVVIDTGVYYKHPDIQQNMWLYNGSYGYNFINNNSDPVDDNGHGTHIAGIISAVGNNKEGIIGVNPQAKIMAVKGLDKQGIGYVDKLAACINYAVKIGAEVINCSWGGEGHSQTMKEAITYALNQGCVVVAAAGNNNVNAMAYSPANIKGVIKVAATDQEDKKSAYSNWGQKIDICAPGGGANSSILSLSAPNSYLSQKYSNCIVGKKYIRLSGTSMSAAYVSGVVSLLISRYPNETIQHLRARIKASADTIDFGKYKARLGPGRLNADKALNQEPSPYFELEDIVLAEVKGDNDQIPESGEQMKLVVSLKNIWQASPDVTATISTTDDAIASINQSQASFGAMNDGQIREATPFEFTIDEINYDTPVTFKLEITNANSFSQTIYFKVDLGILNLTPGTPDCQQLDINISGNIVVWTSQKLEGIQYTNTTFYRDIRQTANKKVPSFGYQTYPDVSGNVILFKAYSNGSALYTYNIDKPTVLPKQQTGSNAHPRTFPLGISGNYIIWEDMRKNGGDGTDDDVYLRNITDPEYDENPLTVENKSHQICPAIDGYKCVWGSYNDSGSPTKITEMYLYDIKAGGDPRRITNDLLYQWWPRISGNNIVCYEESRPDGSTEIILYEVNDDMNNLIVKKTKITPDIQGEFQWYPDISGNKIVWEDKNLKGDYNIYYRKYLGQNSVGPAVQITNDVSAQTDPKIDGKIIIWLDSRNDDGTIDVFMTELQSNLAEQEESK